MRLLIDTSVAIALRDGDQGLIERQDGSGDLVWVSAVTMIELEGGVGRSNRDREKRRAALDAMYDLFAVLPFTRDEARIYGGIVTKLGFSRPRIIDRMIAATALSADLPLATLNEKDFRDVPALRLIDWTH